eukprot:10464602-Alexandrium_andersonii.AAC.1
MALKASRAQALFTPLVDSMCVPTCAYNMHVRTVIAECGYARAYTLRLQFGASWGQACVHTLVCWGHAWTRCVDTMCLQHVLHPSAAM